MKVQIILLTYNHEQFIERALKGVQLQRVNFDLEVLIANDASDDRTKELIERFKTSNPLNIRLFTNSNNKGILYNVKLLLTKVTSPYIAILDGDDYWTNPHKLQNQIDFLDSNLNYNGCFHDASLEHSDLKAKEVLFQGAKTYSQIYQYNETIYLEDVIKRLIIPTSSIVSRSNFITNKNLALLADNFSIAWKLTCLSVLGSKFYYFNETWSSYTNHFNGFSKNDNLGFHYSHIGFLKQILKDKDLDYYKLSIYESLVHEKELIIKRKELRNFDKLRHLLNFTFLSCRILLMKLNALFFKSR